MTLDEFKKAFSKLKKQGYIASTRKGPTGIGHTFETKLGLKENNIALPDISDIEIKAHRENSNSLITLFTFNKKAWRMNQLRAIQKYGSKDKNGRLGIYYTMSRTPNSAGLFLHIEDKEVSVRHTSGEILVCWNLDDLRKRFEEKIPALLLVSARAKKQNNIEYFEFFRVQLMQQTKTSLLYNLFESGDIVIDLRLHDKGTKAARNHGTAFRIYEENLPKLFSKIEDL